MIHSSQMKLSVLTAIAYLLISIKSSELGTSQNRREIICNEDQSDCYPKLFVPTWDWQIIKPGQDIPPGLHVRMNIDTLEREAKLMEPEENDSQRDVAELIVGEGEQLQDKSEEILQELLQNRKHKENDNDHSHVRKLRVSPDDLNNFESAVLEISNYQGDNERLSQALDTLIELSHDIEFGLKLTKDKESFESLRKIVSNTGNKQTIEKVYRILGSSLRNNPVAIQNIIAYNDDSLVNDLFIQLRTHSGDDVIQKRILGVIQALAQNPKFASDYFSFENSFGLDRIIEIYPEFDSQSRARASNILEDLSLFGKSNERRSLEESSPDTEVSRFIQESLANDKINNNDFKLYFNKLTELHEGNKELKPSKKFLGWLAEQVETRKEHRKRDDYSDEDKEFDRQMLIARHEVFGNPMGLRKSFGDEL